MSEPKRWIDDSAPQAIERMFKAAGGEQPSEAALTRTLTVLGIGVGVGTTGTAAAVLQGGAKAALASGAGAFWKWGLVGVFAAVGTIGIAEGIAEYRALSRPVVPAPARSRPPSPARPAAAPSAPPAASAPVSPAVSAEPNRESRPERRNTAARNGTAAAANDAIDVERLGEEVKLVDRARAALAGARPGEAIQVLDEYQARFATRRFEPEALYLRMEALLAQGQESRAREVARALTQTYPRSPHTARARVVLGRAIP